MYWFICGHYGHYCFQMIFIYIPKKSVNSLNNVWNLVKKNKPTLDKWHRSLLHHQKEVALLPLRCANSIWLWAEKINKLNCYNKMHFAPSNHRAFFIEHYCRLFKSIWIPVGNASECGKTGTVIPVKTDLSLVEHVDLFFQENSTFFMFCIT